jgi:D-alanyl-D-alanine dipeptidase
MGPPIKIKSLTTIKDMTRIKNGLKATIKTLLALTLISVPQKGTAKEPFSLQELPPQEGITIELQYKTKNNITNKPLYPKNAKAYLHPDALNKLQRAASLLKPYGYGIIVLDAWRPYTAGAKLWNKALDLGLEAYYCPPEDSGHTRGAAVDVSLYKLTNPKTPVIMPSEFDQPITEFPIPSEKAKNAQVLNNCMNKAGFVGHRREWWHFNLPNLKDYPIEEGENKNRLVKMNYGAKK